MSVSQDPRKTIENRLIAALPASEYQRLVPHLEFVSISLQQVLYESGEPIRHVYFPNQGLVSLVSTMEDGSTVEVGVVGNEGIVGTPVFLGGNTTTNQAFVQVADGCMRMEASRLKAEFNRGGPLQSLLLRYTQALLTQVSQTAACNRLHTVEERLARWLLTVSDRMQSDQFPLTQKFIAQMLGTRRAGVTVAAGILQQAGMIRYTRGKITILNREDLEATLPGSGVAYGGRPSFSTPLTSCECYGLIKAEFERLLSTDRD